MQLRAALEDILTFSTSVLVRVGHHQLVGGRRQVACGTGLCHSSEGQLVRLANLHVGSLDALVHCILVREELKCVQEILQQ